MKHHRNGVLPLKKQAQLLKEKLLSGSLVIGAHTFFTDPTITNLLGYHGFDFVWIDGEHGAFSKPDLLHHIMAAGDAGVASLVRVAWNDPVIIKPVLEMGCDGIILPYVRSAKEARQAVEYCSYPPHGIRGFGPRRAQEYGAMDGKEYLNDVDDSFLRILQIEHVDAINELEEIVQVPGIDFIIVGPNDLSATYGHLGDTNCEEMKQVYDTIAKICKKYHMPFGVSLGVGQTQAYQEWINRGVNAISTGSDMEYMSLGSKQTIKQLREMEERGK